MRGGAGGVPAEGLGVQPTVVKQCAGAGGTALAAPGRRIPPDSEACRIFGSLLVNKVSSPSLSLTLSLSLSITLSRLRYGGGIE